MSPRHCRRLAPLAVLLLVATAEMAAAAAQATDRAALAEVVEAAVGEAMEQGAIPSCTVAVVADGEIALRGAWGQSNLWAGTEARVDTVYLIGSTFKTMATAALLQHMEEGRFELDDPVGPHLGGLSIQGEVAAEPIAFRHLLTHTSGLPAGFGPHPVWGDTVPPPLREFLAGALRVSGPPGDKVEYSNVAFTLVGFLIEHLSRRDFREVMRERIFEPVGMQSTVFQPDPSTEERLAIPYVLDESGRHVPSVRLKADVWPAGIVYGTVEDQARWLLAILGGGRLDGRRILREETVRLCLERQYDEFKGPMAAGWGNAEAGFGLCWWTCAKDGERHFAHSGSVPGYTAFLEGNADRGIGIALLTNGNRAHPQLVRLADRVLRWMRKPESGR